MCEQAYHRPDVDALHPPLAHRTRFRQITSWDDARAPMVAHLAGRLGSRIDEWSRKCATLHPGEPQLVARVEGAGVLSRLFFTLPTFWRASLWREIVLRIRWDGDPLPAVEAPLGDFFGVHFAQYRQYASRFLTVNSGGLVCTAPMPFARGFEIELVQEGSLPVPMVFWGVGYFALDPETQAPSALRFHARFVRESLVPRGAPFTFLETEGRGHYVGVHLSTQNRDLWLRPPLDELLMPRGFGLGHLEGWEELFVDGALSHGGVSAHRGTGHEEYFNAGWYFRDGAQTTLDHGCLHRSYLTGRSATYRYHWNDSLGFDTSFRGVIHHGIRDDIPADYAATAYWYQEGTTRVPSRLPPVRERRVLHPLFARRAGL